MSGRVSAKRDPDHRSLLYKKGELPPHAYVFAARKQTLPSRLCSHKECCGLLDDPESQVRLESCGGVRPTMSQSPAIKNAVGSLFLKSEMHSILYREEPYTFRYTARRPRLHIPRRY